MRWHLAASVVAVASLAQLARAQQQPPNLDPRKLHPDHVFDRIDKNKDGTLSKEEVELFSKDFPDQLGKQMMSLLDKNRDGIVEREEGSQFLNGIFMLANAAAAGKVRPDGTRTEL